jgi:hemerythrin-like domain-containing protein
LCVDYYLRYAVLRNKSLVPLSRQHQHALALCVRIERASPIRTADLSAWQSEIAQHFQNEIRIHFAAEESVLFPVARRFEALNHLVDDLIRDHSLLRDNFAEAERGKMSATALSAFARLMSAHIRKEERQLFERLQELMSNDDLASLGRALDDALKGVEQACILPTETTRLRTR